MDFACAAGECIYPVHTVAGLPKGGLDDGGAEHEGRGHRCRGGSILRCVLVDEWIAWREHARARRDPLSVAEVRGVERVLAVFRRHRMESRREARQLRLRGEAVLD